MNDDELENVGFDVNEAELEIVEFSLDDCNTILNVALDDEVDELDDVDDAELDAELEDVGDAVFVLEKSFAALCFMCILPLSAIGFLSSILLIDHSFWKTAGYVFAFIMTIVGSVSVFCDYFLSMIIIVNGNMYIKCVKTLFRPVVVKLDGAYARYMVSISMPSGSYMVTNSNNKSQLRNTLNHINSALIDGSV